MGDLGIPWGEKNKRTLKGERGIRMGSSAPRRGRVSTDKGDHRKGQTNKNRGEGSGRIQHTGTGSSFVDRGKARAARQTKSHMLCQGTV